MSSGAIKGLEVLLIAGVVVWFAYSQLSALNRAKQTNDMEEETAEGQRER